jgi:FkbM family methyltransferase
VDGRDLSLAPHILMQGDWEAWITTFMQRRLLQRPAEQGAFILDVGANVGWYSLAAYFTREHHYKVLAFEPNPRLAQLLRMTFTVNGLNADWVYQKAAGDGPGSVKLDWRPEYFGGCRVRDAVAEPSGSPVDEGSNASVEQIALDDVIHAGSRVAMVKIDVEGYEPQVIRGAKRILTENPDIELLIEHHQSEEERGMLSELEALGFRTGHVATDGNAYPKSLDEVAELADAEMLYLNRR